MSHLLIYTMTLVLQLTYRVIHLAEGQMEAHADGAPSVNVVTGLPPATRAEPPLVTQVTVSLFTADFSPLLSLYA